MEERFDDISIPDSRILEEIIEGNEAAVGMLFVRYNKMVYCQAYRILCNEDDALDVCHDAFLRFLSFAEKNKTALENVPAYLRKISLNLSLDLVRRRKRQSLADKIPLLSLFWNKSSKKPWNSIAEQELHDVLMRAILTLSDVQQKMVVLRHFEDLKLMEIASVCECTVGSVKKNLFRAYEKLRKNMDKKKAHDMMASDIPFDFSKMKLSESDYE